ncbi:ketoreductase RED1 [Corynebacterium mycetoides]|uniref:Ketoreductase RED1 n=1 Tax=Corynebacterium mycetoides TaxID=38302 RepID=A0A1G9LBA5_9CORY|nr:3-hydroxyacyl-CoA dehydrogenase NAD-binding domain-containing protein [Corynebacterium mycetoides]SDL59261.1 ketoreductase RED1 [Corynebacterium mycetoides]
MSTAMIFGGGLIGMSFAERFAEHGWAVRVVDVRPEVGEDVAKRLGEKGDFFTDLEAALDGVDFVQEAGPEKIEFKNDIFRQFAQFAPENAILASSSSALLPSKIAEGNPAADRIIVGHPFTPPDLMPVLEIVPSPETSTETLDRAMEVYRGIGFDPSRLNKEIPGFVGNRIQKAIMMEAIYLIQEGVVDVENFDRIVRNSLGLRYAAVGPFEANRLGGGPDGITKLFDTIFRGWEKSMPAGEPDMDNLDGVIAQVNEAYGNDTDSFTQRSEVRDAKLKGIVEAISEVE